MVILVAAAVACGTITAGMFGAVNAAADTVPGLSGHGDSGNQGTYYTVNVTTDPAEGGTVSGDGAYLSGSKVNLTATPNEGYEFAGWYDDSGTVKLQPSTEYTFTISKNTSLQARFKKKEYTINTVGADMGETIRISQNKNGSQQITKSESGKTIYVSVHEPTNLKVSRILLDDGTQLSVSESLTNSSTKLASFTMPARDVTVTVEFMSENYDCSLISDCDTIKYRVPEFVFEKICDTKTPQGVLAVIKQDSTELLTLKENGLYLFCDNVSDPGNMGTLIRTADAAGFDGVLLSPGCVELYNPKTVRASMGSFFRMNVYSNVILEKLKAFKNDGAEIFGGALCDDTIDYREPDYDKTTIIAVGNEANGITNEVLSICTPIKIPIYGGAESLNVGIAAGIMMYHAANSRQNIQKIR